MKKALYVALALCMMFLFSCSSGDKTGAAPSNGAEAEKESAASLIDTAGSGYDVDLVGLSSTLVYAQVYDMMVYPEKYIGKSIRICGMFEVYSNNLGIYFACVVPDALACCTQGIEFDLEGEHVYPEDYPEIGELITVSGTFNTYLENGMTYAQLQGAKLE